MTKLTGDILHIRYVKLDDAVLWDRNPKQHDLEAIVHSIWRHGFRDASIFDGSLGAIAAGNGRLQAVRRGYDEGRTPPLGIATDSDGAWFVPIQFGIDAESRVAAESFGVDHNNLTISGTHHFEDMARMWDETELADLLVELRNEEMMPVTVDSDDLDELLREMGNAGEPPNEGADTEAQIGQKEQITCPHCGEEFDPERIDGE